MDTHTKNIIMVPFNILYKISPKLELKLLFRIKQGYKLNLKNPKTFNEKLQWIKLYDKNPLMPKCVDKYTVRKYISEAIGDKYLIPLLAVYDNPDEIEYDKLPDRFVIKLNTGSGYNIIVKNKEELDRNKANRQLKKWLNEDYAKMKKEPQ